MAPPFTVPCEGCENRFLHRSHQELNPGSSHGSPLHKQLHLILFESSLMCLMMFLCIFTSAGGLSSEVGHCLKVSQIDSTDFLVSFPLLSYYHLTFWDYDFCHEYNPVVWISR